jgi:hypothetical protein
LIILTHFQILREFPVLNCETTPFTINALLARQLAYARSKATGGDSDSEPDGVDMSDSAQVVDSTEVVNDETNHNPSMSSFGPDASIANLMGFSAGFSSTTRLVTVYCGFRY